jgi:tetratricopeptide (TPR) repeat protein
VRLDSIAFPLVALLTAAWLALGAPAPAAEPDRAGSSTAVDQAALRGARLDDAQLDAALVALKQVGSEGAGHAQAQAAWRKLAELDPARLPALLAAIDDANPLAANWIRSAIDTIAARELAGGGKLPLPAIEEFLRDRKHAPRARRLAFELLVAADPPSADRWLPRLLDDPSLELRRDAVARLLDQGSSLAKAEDAAPARDAFQQALASARDLDQVKRAAEELKKLGIDADLPKQFGFITRWKVVGPFDNSGGRGFVTAYPPEEKVDLSATYDGKAGAIGWRDAESGDELGTVDLNRALGTAKGAVAYAFAEFTSSARLPVELRIGSPNANKIWLNGRPVSDAQIYHSFTAMDQYVGRATLEPGANRILVKLCQNEQTEEWASDWKFQLRVCDATGGAILSEERK